jgi:hypothetical protein
VAKVDDQLRIQNVETWFDPMEMFRQIARNGNVERIPNIPIAGQDLTSQLFGEDHDEHGHDHVKPGATDGTCPFVGKQ